MKSIAFLILAHDQPKHLAKLVKALDAPWIHVFIHIDACVDASPFKQSVPERRNVYFLTDEQRVYVQWGKFSMVQATLHLLYVSYLHEDGFDRFCLLSGSDYPVRSLSVIRASFKTEREFLNVSHCLDGREKSWHQDCVDFAYDEASGKPTPRNIETTIPIYQGSQWWSLTRGCIEWVFDYMREHPEYIDFYKLTRCPDEIFFQSIVMHSPFRDCVEMNRINKNAPSIHPCLYGCHYIDWRASPGQGLPKILTTVDYPEMLRSGALFARKIRHDLSGDLMKVIEQRQVNQASKEKYEE